MSERIVVTKDNNTNIVINLDDLFYYHGERKLKNTIERRVGNIITGLSIFLIISPYLWLLYTGAFTVKEIWNPSFGILNVANIGLWLFIYGLYLRRDRNVFDRDLEEGNLNEVRNLIKKGTLKIYELENAFSVEVLQIFDEIYQNYKDHFISALSDYIVSLSKENELLVSRLGIDLPTLKNRLLLYFQTYTTSFDAVFSEFAKNLYEKASYIESDYIDEKIVLATLLDTYWKDVLDEFNITEKDIKGFLLWLKNEQKAKNYQRKWKRLSKLKPRGDINRAYTSRATPTLDQFGIDLTSKVISRGFVFSIGRESEMKDLLRVLDQDKNSSAVVVGAPGVGKTRFLEYLATRMVIEDVPKGIRDSRLVSIDLNLVFTKAGTIDNFKQILQKILNEVVASRNLVIVFEDFSRILSIRTDGKYEVINTLVSMMTQHNIKTITTTTFEAFFQDFKPLPILATLFNSIILHEPNKEVSLQILIDEAQSLEKQKKIRFNISALKKIVEFSDEFDFDRVMPDKGLRILSEAIIVAREKRSNLVDTDIVDELLSKKTGSRVGNIQKEEAELLKNLEKEMHKRIVGQDKAISAVASALRRARAGITNKQRPISSFLFFGPTGVGKTEVAKAIASIYYGDERNIIRLDMSEYQEDANVNRLLGFNDKYGKFIGGYLVNSVRQKPYSLILLDEIEKANPKVLDLFLQILDEGAIKDGMGRKVDFTNTIIIATSNVASKEIMMLFEQGEKYIDVLAKIAPLLRRFFKVEFINRFDNVIMFRPLTLVDLEQIAYLMLEKVKNRLLEKGMDMKWNKNTLLKLIEKGYSKAYGARELNRAIQETIENALANAIIEGKLKSGDTAIFDGLDIIGIK
jgi:ATP-dependent Clp protease ATP-binding subunit ClpC